MQDLSSPTVKMQLLNQNGLYGDRVQDVTFKFAKHIVLDNVDFQDKSRSDSCANGRNRLRQDLAYKPHTKILRYQLRRVLVDGVNVRKRKLSQLRSQIGMATQDVLLFSDTIDGNIAYGDSDMSEEDVKHYAKLAAANEFVEMPDGYETIVGRRGVGLSGGQSKDFPLQELLRP